MEDPVKEIPAIIQGLTTLSPSHQSHVLDRYFLPTAGFHHPMCYVPSFCLWKRGSEGSAGKPQIDSRMLIKGIYRWYKMMSPTIEMNIHSVAWDLNLRNGNAMRSTLYVDCTQTMYFWFLPSWYRKAEVGLVIVLGLERHEVDGVTDDNVEEKAEQDVDDASYLGEKLAGSERDEVEGSHRKMKWFIAKQRDLYPPEDLAQFALIFPGTTLFVYWFQIVGTLFSVIAAQVGKLFGFFPDESEDVCPECQENPHYTPSVSSSRARSQLEH